MSPVVPPTPALASKRKKQVRKILPQVCVACGATENLTIDHKKPRCFGGTNDLPNLQMLCEPCNTRKSSREQPRQRPWGMPKSQTSTGKKRKAWFERVKAAIQAKKARKVTGAVVVGFPGGAATLASADAGPRWLHDGTTPAAAEAKPITA